jgi:N-acyl homoserine lactone hydrolase
VKLYVLRLGTVEVDVAKFMAMEPERGKRYAGPVTAFLIETDDGGHVLVDTGLAPEHVDDPQARLPQPDVVVTMRPEDDIVHQLGRIGLAPADIGTVINTHFDFDHCGGNRHFRHADLYVQRSHYEWASQTETPWRQDWDLEGVEYRLVDGEAEIVDGIRAIPTPGHVPGHASLTLTLPNTGAVIIAGDAAQTHVMFEEERVLGTPDPEQVRASIRALKAIRDRHGATVFVCHDVDRVYRELPAYYD